MSEEINRVIEITCGETDERIDTYITEKLDGFSRTYIQKLIKNDFVFLNSEICKASSKVSQNDKILINLPPPEPSDILPENIPIDVIYEDDSLLVINKRKKISIHPSPNQISGTLVNALLYHCKNLSGISGVLKPGIVHRLDKDTSGVLVVAKNDEAHLSLAKQISERTAMRRYLAVIHGHITPLAGKINAPIGRADNDRKKMTIREDNSKEAITDYHIDKRFKFFDLIEVKLLTGRTHQIRVHFSHLGHPVAGDPLYGGKIFKNKEMKKEERKIVREALEQLQGQALHAKILGFKHPATDKWIQFETEPPEDIKGFISFLENLW